MKPIVFILAFVCGPLFGEESYFPVPDAVYTQRLLPAVRFGGDYTSLENKQHKYYFRSQTIRLFGEYAFNEFVSIGGNAPWTRRKETGTRTHTRYDNMGLFVHLAYPGSSFTPVGGLDFTLATGDADVLIGSKRLFNLEPYGGLAFHYYWFSLTGVLRYNTQTNKTFREDPDEKDDFARTWKTDVVMGFNFTHADLLLEYQYRYTYDPDPKRLSVHTLAPGANLKIGHFIAGISIPLALSKEREFGKGVILRFSGRF
jgi:hypothetical protein